MDPYSLLKTLHVLSATAWVGGGLMGIALGFTAARSRSDEALLDTMAQLEWCARRIFVPCSFATLGFGLGMTWLGNLWLDAWIVVGLVGIAAVIAMGIVVLGPRIDRLLALRAAGRTLDAVRLARQVLLAASLDGVLLVLIVIDMVLKPASDDWPVLVAMLAIALIAALLLLPRALATASLDQTTLVKDNP